MQTEVKSSRCICGHPNYLHSWEVSSNSRLPGHCAVCGCDKYQIFDDL